MLECALVTQVSNEWVCTQAQTTLEYYTDLCLQRYDAEDGVDSVQQMYIGLECVQANDVTTDESATGTTTNDVSRTATLVGPYVTMFDGYQVGVSLPGVYHVMTVDAAQPITTQATYMPHGDNSRRLTEVGLQQNDVTVTITHNDVTGALEVEVVEGESTTSVEYPQIVDAGDFSVEFVSENSVVIRDADGMTTRVVNNDALSVNVRAPAGYPHDVTGMLGNNNGDMYDDVNFGDGSGRDVGTAYLVESILSDDYVAEHLVDNFRLTSDDDVFVDDTPIDSTGGHAVVLPPGSEVDYPDVDIAVDEVTVGVSVRPEEADDGSDSNVVTRIELTDDETDDTIAIETRLNDGQIEVVTSPGTNGDDETVTSTGISAPIGDWTRVFVTLDDHCNVAVVTLAEDGTTQTFDDIPAVCNSTSGYTVNNVSIGSDNNNIGMEIDDVTLVDEERTEEQIQEGSNSTLVDPDTRFQVDFNDPEHPTTGTVYEDWENPNDNEAGSDVTGEEEGDGVIEPVVSDFPYAPEPPSVEPPVLVSGEALAFCESGLANGVADNELSMWLAMCVNEHVIGGENAAQAVIDAAIGSNPQVDPETPPTVDTDDSTGSESCFTNLAAGTRFAEWTSRYVYDFNGVQTFLNFVGLYSGVTISGDVEVQGLFRPLTTFTSSFSELAVSHGADVIAVLAGSDGVEVFLNDVATSYPYGTATSDDVIVVSWMDDQSSSLFESFAVKVIVRDDATIYVRQQTSGSLHVKIGVNSGAGKLI